MPQRMAWLEDLSQSNSERASCAFGRQPIAGKAPWEQGGFQECQAWCS